MTGVIHRGGAAAFRSASRIFQPDDQVQQQVAGQHDHIPEEKGAGRRIKKYIQDPSRLPEIHKNEKKGHDHGGHCQKFSENVIRPKAL